MTLVYVPLHVCGASVRTYNAHITRITQVTLKTINDKLLVNNLRLSLLHFKFLINFVAYKHGQDSCLHFKAKILELFLDIISAETCFFFFRNGDCFEHEMLFIRQLNPNLNVQSDSVYLHLH